MLHHETYLESTRFGRFYQGNTAVENRPTGDRNRPESAIFPHFLGRWNHHTRGLRPV